MAVSASSNSPRVTNEGSLVVVAGGVRSGKSRFALELASRQGPRRCFVATAEPFDDEMRRRIALHQEERRGQFVTREAPVGLVEVARRLEPADVVLVDCLTIYLSNLLLRAADVEGWTEEQVAGFEQEASLEVRDAIFELRQRTPQVILVTNEVGLGVVPVSRMGRIFRDLAGRVNQAVAAQADQVWWCALGIPLCIKPSPLAVPSHAISQGM